MEHEDNPEGAMRHAAAGPMVQRPVPAVRRGSLRSAAALAKAAAVPLGACFLALVALTAYTATGAAGAPSARIGIARAYVLLPTNPTVTAAVFTIRNTGDSPDTLLSARSPALGTGMLTTAVIAHGAGRMKPVTGVRVPPHGTVAMAPGGLDVMVTRPPELRPGQKIAFDLRFASSGTIRVQAVVVRPGS